MERRNRFIERSTNIDDKKKRPTASVRNNSPKI